MSNANLRERDISSYVFGVLLLACLLFIFGVGCTSEDHSSKKPGSSFMREEATAARLPKTATPTATVKINSKGHSAGIRLWVLEQEIPENKLPEYDRKTWRHWVDRDRDCQNTRVEVLIEEALNGSLVMGSDGCKVISGKWQDIYTDKVYTDPKSLDIDHLIPLANAHKSGGWAWDSSEKRAFANDLSNSWHLLAVESSGNRSKGAKGPESWRPKNKESWCRYAKEWSNIKSAYRLWVTVDEVTALEDMLSGCPAEDVVTTYKRPVDEEIIESLLKRFREQTTITPSESNSSLKYDPFGPDKDCSDFKQWIGAQDFFIAAGGPAEDRHRLDGNKDGIACNSLRGAPKS